MQSSLRLFCSGPIASGWKSQYGQLVIAFELILLDVTAQMDFNLLHKRVLGVDGPAHRVVLLDVPPNF